MRKEEGIGYHLRIIGMVIRVRVSILLQYKGDILYWILVPLLWIVPFIFVGDALTGGEFSDQFLNSTGSGDYIGFLLIGNMLWATLDAAIWGTGNALRWEQQSGTLEYFWVSPAPRVDFLIGAAISEGAWVSTNILGQFIILSFFFDWNLTFFTSSIALLAVVLMFFAMLGFGMVFASIVLLFKEGDIITEFVDSILVIASPLRYPLSALPRFLLWFAIVLPFTWGASIVRDLFLSEASSNQIVAGFGILLLLGALLWTLGLLLFRMVETRSRVKGTLGAF